MFGIIVFLIVGTIPFAINILIPLISIYRKQKQYQKLVKDRDKGSLLYQRIVTVPIVEFKDDLKKIVKFFLLYIIFLVLLMLLVMSEAS
ncbi:hypothetical protein ACVRZP_05480 [Streptococcus gallolyticus subsp. gallolyticus]